LGTLGAVASSILVGYGLSRFNVPFSKTIMVVLIATIILPGFATLVPKYALFYRIGWVGTFLPLIVPHFFANAFNVFLLRQYFLTIPKELDEAAIIDGAGPFRTLWSVILPQMKAAIVAVNLIQSGSLLALIIPVVVFLFAQRVFLQGIDLSGVQK
jgi:multiple sugar transport system permease protein